MPHKKDLSPEMKKRHEARVKKIKSILKEGKKDFKKADK
jgi:hypothetical protein